MSELIPFIDKNSFELKDKIKDLSKGKAKFENKVWMIPPTILDELKRLSQEITSINMVPFIDKNSFDLKDKIKELSKGKAKFENKVWHVPSTILDELKRLSNELSTKSQDKWKLACKKCGYQFVKKGTDQYQEVLEIFKKLMVTEEEEKEEVEEYDEDDVVFD